MKKRQDTVSIIESAYALERTPIAWLEGVAASFSAAFGSRPGAMAFQYNASSRDWVYVDEIGLHCLPAEFPRLLFDQGDLPREKAVELAHLFATVRAGTLKSTVGKIDPIFLHLLRRFGMDDMLVINALEPTRCGCLVVVGDPSRLASPRVLYNCRRIGVHISAGNRLRRALAALEAQGTEPTDSAEAVLKPDGRIEHVVGPAKRPAAREALRSALVKIDAARSREVAPEQSLKLWSGLVSGRWSLIEHFERDGRRYYLAHKNEPEVPVLKGLTRRERQVCALAQLGNSNKLIAYSLGVSLSTVSSLLSRARRKLADAGTNGSNL